MRTNRRFSRSWLARKLNGINKTVRVFVPLGKRALVVIPFRSFSLIPLVLLILASGYLLLRSDIFLVRQVEIVREGGFQSMDISSEMLLHSDSIREVIEPFVIARSLWSIDAVQVEEAVKSMHSSISKVEIQRKLPDSIIVVVREREPVAILSPLREETTPDGQHITKVEFYLIDSEGEVYQSIPKKADLPTFVYPSLFSELGVDAPIIGHKFERDSIRQLVAVSDALQPLPWLTIDTISLTDDWNVTITSTGNVTLIMSLTKDLAEQVRALELIQQQIVYTGRSVEYLDTRFDKVVLRYRE